MKPDRVVVGTDNPRTTELLRALYDPFTRNHDRLIVMDIRSAELTKYAANAMLATKISFMNELANVAERVGADIEKVRVGIGSDPRIGYGFIYPGTGYGGSCFPKDVKALIRSAREVGYATDILHAVEAVNERQKSLLVRKLRKVLGGALKGRSFALWGLAFKPNTDDMREAPSRVIIDELIAAGASVCAYDPVAMQAAARLYEDNAKWSRSGRDAYEACEDADALLIATEWREFRSPDFDRLKQLLAGPRIFDGSNLYEPALLARLGFEYYATGRGLPAVRRIETMSVSETTLIPVVLSGGAGTRLWPLSRELYPKQLLPLTGPHTMLQDTLRRLAGLDRPQPPVVVCNEAHRFLVAEQLRAIGCRPQAHRARTGGPQHCAGHRTGRTRGTRLREWRGAAAGTARRPRDPRRGGVSGRAVRTAAAGCARRSSGDLRRRSAPPETGYGYIRRGAALPGRGWRIARFVEKPERECAEQFIASGDYYWNSGMFLFGARRYLEELRRHARRHRGCLRTIIRRGQARS